MSDICFPDGTITAPNGAPLSYDGIPNVNFRLLFPKAPMLTMFLQRFDLPGLEVREVSRTSPVLDMNEIGEKINYIPFTVEFLVDKNLYNYKEIHSWIQRMTVRGTTIGETDNPVLIINNRKMITFSDAWPTALGQMSFVTTANDVIYITCTATFRYDMMIFDEIS